MAVGGGSRAEICNQGMRKQVQEHAQREAPNYLPNVSPSGSMPPKGVRRMSEGREKASPSLEKVDTKCPQDSPGSPKCGPKLIEIGYKWTPRAPCAHRWEATGPRRRKRLPKRKITTSHRHPKCVYFRTWMWLVLGALGAAALESLGPRKCEKRLPQRVPLGSPCNGFWLTVLRLCWRMLVRELLVPKGGREDVPETVF